MVKNGFKYIIIPTLRVICHNMDREKIFENFSRAIDTTLKICYNPIRRIIQIIQISRERGELVQTRFTGKQDVYLEIAEQYKQYIKLGVIKTGEKLPSVRALAGELGVNPNTVARAYSTLEEEGFVRALPKKGAYVTYGEKEMIEPDKKSVIIALKDMGVSKNSILKWIEEVYREND